MKKFLLIILSLVLTLSLLVSCGDDSVGANKSASPNNGGSNIANEQKNAYYTLFADFSAGSTVVEPQTKDIPLPPTEEIPASNSALAFFLADSLSEWTGLDFTLNDVAFSEDSVTVDWSADSTLIAGLDDREQKEEFHFFDAVSLNWFMMDSLALTLKHNLPVTTVYYCSDGGPVTFTNPEDMAALGLPELPVDQSYEGSAFFAAHSDSWGDDINDADVPEWWGEYKSDEAFCSIAVTNFNGTSFNFEIYFLRDGRLLYDGVAAVDPDNSFIAENSEFSFSLSGDFNVIGISVPKTSEWSHLSGSYERIEANETAGNYEYYLWLSAWLEGFVWESGNKFVLDDEVMVYTDTLANGDDIRVQIEAYLSLQGRKVSEWLSFDTNEALSEQLGYPVWIAEYYIGNEEDTNLCVDAVVQAGEWDGHEYTLILHTVRDADLDMNSDIDYGARIMELFETIEITKGYY